VFYVADVFGWSYPELHAVRVAFQTYESGVSNGMLIDERTLQRSLKVRLLIYVFITWPVV